MSDSDPDFVHDSSDPDEGPVNTYGTRRAGAAAPAESSRNTAAPSAGRTRNRGKAAWEQSANRQKGPVIGIDGRLAGQIEREREARKRMR
jgi:hypothetical protein